MKSERTIGAAHARDLIICKIIGLQNELGNDQNNPQYQILQKLMDDIVEECGDLFKEYTA